MCRFVESIKLKDGVFYRLKLHQERVNKAFAACYPTEEPISIFENLNQLIVPQEGIYKCRMVYDEDVQLLELVPYERREIRTLKLVETNLESLAYKLEDRTGFNAAFAQRGFCDDVLLVKNGLLTDTSYCNIALYDGQNWFTPLTPLLYGVNRAELLAQEILIEKDITVEELKNYQKIAMFNAMIEFGEMVLDIDKIF
ncbi:MAG TPA: aminotransferase class IV [Paludibacter sp.]